MQVLTTRLLRSPHGFPTREGGVSGGPFTSLNVSFTVGDERECVEENLRRLEHAAGVPGRLFTVTQVHSDTMVEAGPGSGSVEADALWTSRPSTAVGVRTADCIPVLLESDSGAVAAVHAGWRGVHSEIVRHAVSALGGPSAVRVAVGPCIQRCCYEVSEDLARHFARTFGAGVVAPRPGGQRPHLDLVAALRVTLERLGVRDDAVELVPACTSCDGRFFSHRRDRGHTGRHLAFITRA